MRKLFLLFTLISIMSVAGCAWGQVNPGTPSWSSYDSHGIDTINLQNLNVFMNVSVMSKSGAFPLQFGMTGNFYVFVASNHWYPSVSADGGGLPTFYAEADKALVMNTGGSGGYLWGRSTSIVACPPPNQTTNTTKYFNFFDLERCCRHPQSWIQTTTR